MRMLLPIAISTLILTQAASAAKVPAYREGPWCANYNFGAGEVESDCPYATVEACVPNVIMGNRGFCGPNPRWSGPDVVRRKRRAHR